MYVHFECDTERVGLVAKEAEERQAGNSGTCRLRPQENLEESLQSRRKKSGLARANPE